MSTQLEQKLNLILNEKETKILPENIKKDVQIFDIVGTLENSGIDTSDATANANDLALNKTAYVNGEKITGNISEVSSSAMISGGKFAEHTPYLAICNDTDLLLRAGGAIEITEAQVATKGNITPEKIVKGNTIFGVEGTYNGPAKTVSSDEITNIIAKAETLQAALIELSILTSEQTLSTLGYTTTMENDVITFDITGIGVYSIDSQDTVRNEQGEQVYPVVQENSDEVETPIEGNIGGNDSSE